MQRALDNFQRQGIYTIVVIVLLVPLQPAVWLALLMGQLTWQGIGDVCLWFGWVGGMWWVFMSVILCLCDFVGDAWRYYIHRSDAVAQMPDNVLRFPRSP